MKTAINRQILEGHIDTISSDVVAFFQKSAFEVHSAQSGVIAKKVFRGILPIAFRITIVRLDSVRTEVSIESRLDRSQWRRCLPPGKLWLMLPGVPLAFLTTILAASGRWGSAVVLGLPGLLLLGTGFFTFYLWLREMEGTGKDIKSTVSHLWHHLENAG